MALCSSIVAILALGLALPSAAAAESAAKPDLALEVELIESARGLRFVRPPRVEVVEAGAPFRAALTGIRDRLPIECPAPGFTMRPVASAAADPASDRVVVSTQARPDEIRVALAQLLDSQHHPGLARDAVRRSGDAGIAQRGLLAASACTAAQGGFGLAHSEDDEAGPFDDPVIEVEPASDGERLLQTATAAASTFLSRLPDREAAFRRPPLSTLELLQPGRWEAREPPLELVGDPPVESGCIVVHDESLGVLASIRALTRAGGRVPRGAFVGWRGDRLIRFTCEDGRTPALYVAVFGRKTDAEDFRSAAEKLLPDDIPRPVTAATTSGTRVVAWHALDEAQAKAFGSSLETRPLR